MRHKWLWERLVNIKTPISYRQTAFFRLNATLDQTPQIEAKLQIKAALE